MILLAGAFQLVPLLGVLVLAAAVSLPLSIGWSLGAAVLHTPWLTAAGLLLVGLAAGAVTERAFRRREAAFHPEFVVTLAALGTTRKVEIGAVGGKALQLARGAGLGVPVPEGIVLTSALVDRILAATAGGKGIDTVWPVLPPAARHSLEAFLASAKGKLVARASFTDHGASHSYAGVSPAIAGVDPRDRERLLEAVMAVVASADDAIGREYRRRHRAPAGIARAVILQRQLEAEVVGAILSRGPSGAADSVTVDYARRRSPVHSYRYDLVLGMASPVGSDDRFDTPAWMHRLAILAVTLEEEMGGPVRLEFALEEGQPFLLDVRRVASAARKTWVHGAPLDASGERQPTFAQELRGGLPLVREVLQGTLARAGAEGSVREDEVRYVDGLVYFDAEVIRRALARLGADVLLQGGLRATLLSVARVKRRALPSVPTVTEITPEAWGKLRDWHLHHLVGAARVRLELVARIWLVKSLLRLLDGTSSSAEDRRGHPALRWVLARRVRQATEEAERQRTVLEQAEAELSSAVARLLARGAEGWGAMFKGDRHLHATFEEIDRWHDDIGAREGLEAEWKARRLAFDQRKDQPTHARVHRPPIGADIEPAAPDRVHGVPVVDGKVSGPLVLVTGHERGGSTGALLLLADARSDLCPHVYDARGIVLLTGGLASPVVQLAAELGVPTVLCRAARPLATRDVTLDGATGTLTVIA